MSTPKNALATIATAALFVTNFAAVYSASINRYALPAPQDLRSGPPERECTMIDISPPDSLSSAAVKINDRGDIMGTFDPLGEPTENHTFLYRNGVTIDTGTLGGSHIERPVDLNNKGDVVGISSDFDRRAFLYSDGELIDLGDLGGPKSFPAAINERGDVVGWSIFLSDTESHAFLYRNGEMIDLGTLLGLNAEGDESEARDINDRGDIVGISTSTEIFGPDHAFLFQDGEMIDLGTLGGSFSSATLINNRGDIAGFSAVEGDAVTHAFLFRDGVLIDLTPNVTEDTVAADLNKRGEVAIRDETRSFVFSDGTLTEIAAPGVTSVQAFAINDKGEVVGSAFFPGDTEVHAFLYRDGELIDLGTLGGGSSVAVDINNKGEVIGTSDGRAFLVASKACKQ